MLLLIDTVNGARTMACTAGPEKIKANFSALPFLKESVETQRKNNEKPFTVISGSGRWFVVYQENKNTGSSSMHCIDFRTDMLMLKETGLFSPKTIGNLQKRQANYRGIYRPTWDNLAFTFAEPYETELRENVYVCTEDNRARAKAKELGVLPMIELLHGEERIRTCIADEIVQNDDGTVIIHRYAFMHIEGNKDASGNGYMYVKLYNLHKNSASLLFFEEAILVTGGTI